MCHILCPIPWPDLVRPQPDPLDSWTFIQTFCSTYPLLNHPPSHHHQTHPSPPVSRCPLYSAPSSCLPFRLTYLIQVYPLTSNSCPYSPDSNWTSYLILQYISLPYSILDPQFWYLVNLSTQHWFYLQLNLVLFSYPCVRPSTAPPTLSLLQLWLWLCLKPQFLSLCLTLWL